MKEILNAYCKQSNPGLLLLSMPTGSGKTYHVLEFIYSNYQEFAAQKRKILFITNLKKNLPLADLRKHFIEGGNEADFDKYVLFINSNSDSVIDNLLNLDNEITEEFKTENYKKLRKYVDLYKKQKFNQQEFKSILKEQIEKILEPGFRKFIQKKLKEIFKTKQARLEAIKNKQEYQWIGKLYPAVFTDEKTVLFLSIDKFIVRNSTLVEPSYYFYEHSIDKALIFIDEFDTTKEVILKSIIQSGLEHQVDLLDLFLNIHNHLMQNEFPEKLLTESKRRSRKKLQSLQELVENLKTQANDIFNKYKLHHTCKSQEDFSTNKRSFLFYDYQFHYVLDRHQSIKIIEDLENRTNWIKAFDPKAETTNVDISSLLRDVVGFLNYFQTGIGYLAQNYCHLKEEDKSIKETFSLESSIKTVLNHFRLDTKDVEFLANNIIQRELQYELQTKKRTIQDQGFYDTGFLYHDIVDSDEHDTLSKIYMFNFSRTPESLLVGVSSKAMVVGISATAGLYTNIGNYDIEYLKFRLGDSFIRLREDTLVHLKNAYSQATKGYDKVVIKTEFIGKDTEKDAIKQLEEILNDREAAQALWNNLRHSSTRDKEEDVKDLLGLYVRALTAWKYFLEHPDCHGFLCLFNKLPKDDDPEFDKKRLFEYAELLLDGNKDIINDSISEIIVVLSSQEFDQSKEKLLNELKNNKRRFIISTYQTIGVGQNLQFPIPEGIEPIHINDFSKHKSMDINGIYLDKPTNLVVNIYTDKIKSDDFIKYLFQLEFMRENGDISFSIFKRKLDQVFHWYLGDKEKYNPKIKDISLYDTGAYSRFLNKIIIQAIGRICRTNMKSPTIHILADASIRKHLTRFSIPEDVIPVHEYTALLKLVNESTRQSEDLIEIQNRASNRSNWCSAYIRRQLNTPWTNNSIKEWQDLRDQVLRQPVIEKKSKSDPKWHNIYLKLPKAADSYYFSEEQDYNEIEVFFSDKYGKKQVKKVCEKTSRLSDLMKIDILHQLFIDSGWATTFPQSELMLTPAIFNNIYKGALGEVCGKHIFETLCHTPLLELDIHEFELFDFKTTDNIYIDFKLWNDQVVVEADKLIKKIREKMERVKAKKVFIINILGTSNTGFTPIISSDKKIFEVPYLCKNDKVDHEAIKFILEEF